ncbi:mitochondrial translation release factor 1 [Bombus vancouverensis nearcticus]|uniref:Peptide chain release factor 1 n=1 Tax=Bombus bifarius TaxID=103933 RepID=A0A6P8N8X5_9HYME|nr:peptide chain release factor 1 [Bombus vancouverensis nearcticus]XP_033311050.1 peptide chain release factor 1 [Bombus bifarius]
MLFLIRGCSLNSYQYCRNFIAKTKLIESCYPVFLNLNKKANLSICQFCSKATLFVTNEHVRKYLDHLMNAYQNGDEKRGSISDILKIHEIPQLLNEKIKIIENIKDLNDLVPENEEMKDLIRKEDLAYARQMSQIDGKILDIILQKVDTENYDNVVMEIIPGVGGQEAMLFAKDLLVMYVNYFDHLGFSYETLEQFESDTGGLRRATLLITDNNAFKKLKYESGVHRVQRIPATEKSGRLHTSTAVVIITPEPKDVDIKIDEKDLIIESKKASGAGGQHVNTTDSAIRITHIPTGKVVTCQTNRSQIKNKQLALTKLKTILFEEQLDQQVSLINKIRKKQMGSRLRNEKIRTYNFNQDRITDHRISNGTMHNLREFMENGADLEILEDRLYKDMQPRTTLEIIEEMMSQFK